eukprot:6292588-Prymnesium_polylepis.1
MADALELIPTCADHTTARCASTSETLPAGEEGSALLTPWLLVLVRHPFLATECAHIARGGGHRVKAGEAEH